MQQVPSLRRSILKYFWQYLFGLGCLLAVDYLELFIPPLRLCGDNAAMIGAQGYYEFLAGHTAGSDLNAYASMDINGTF